MCCSPTSLEFERISKGGLVFYLLLVTNLKSLAGKNYSLLVANSLSPRY